MASLMWLSQLQAEAMARASEAKARDSEALAELRAIEAREEARASRLMSMRMLSMSALGMIDLTSKDHAASWELKTVYAVLSRLAGMIKRLSPQQPHQDRMRMLIYIH